MRRVTWLGHATVLIEAERGTRLVTDPVLRGRVAHLRRQGALPPVPDAIDAILLSHVHRDHLDRPSLRRLAAAAAASGASPAVVLPRGARRFVDGVGLSPIHEVSAGTTLRIGAVDVRAVEAWHPSRRSPHTRRLDALGFVADRIWFAGDTDLDERMALLRGSVDVALVPIWGWGPRLGPGHLDPERAARAVALVAPRIAVPIHWGTYLPYSLRRRHGHLLTMPARAFAAHVERLAPSVRVVTLAPGESVAPDGSSA